MTDIGAAEQGRFGAGPPLGGPCFYYEKSNVQKSRHSNFNRQHYLGYSINLDVHPLKEAQSVYVIYSSVDEVIVCTTLDEDKVKRFYFEEAGRDFDDYDRTEAPEAPIVNSSLRVC